jgi:catechol 2,3-dioxygenase-like lactoylglutathione lyase family enzyme
MTTTEQPQNIVATTGPAAGRLQGINHLQLVVRNMDDAVRFYRDVLGLKVVRTMGQTTLDESYDTPVTRNYFFSLANGEMVTLIEIADADEPERSIWDLWPAGSPDKSTRKLDHLAFNVSTLADLAWFRDHLRSCGVKVTDIVGREAFVQSIYFSDPTGNPLEIATFDWENPYWRTHRAEDWMDDDDAVPSLYRES